MPSAPYARDRSNCPAALFLALYQEAEQWVPTQRFAAPMPEKCVLNEILEVLEQDKVRDVMESLSKVLVRHTAMKPDIGRALAVMSGIDDIFYRIHPRAVRLPPSKGSVPLPAWLVDLREVRRRTGAYATSLGWRMIPRGPLLRSPREAGDAYADKLADRFAALGVAAEQLKQENRRITVIHFVIPSDKARGIAPARRAGAESVAFLPLAENATNLFLTQRDAAGKSFLRIEASPTFFPPDVLKAALHAAPAVDLAVAPELVMSETHGNALPDILASMCTKAPCLLVAGSGSTEALDDQGTPWNEARMFNSVGKMLWRQRKIWPAGMDKKMAEKFGLAGNANSLLMEDYASGTDLCIIDADALGRCVILICQDLEEPTMVSDLLIQYQPDWVFVPILDKGIAHGGWVHQRASDWSRLSQARFLVASSLTLADKAGIKDAACGLAVAPHFDKDDKKGRQIQFVTTQSGSNPGFAIVQWGEGCWSVSTLGVKAGTLP